MVELSFKKQPKSEAQEAKPAKERTKKVRPVKDVKGGGKGRRFVLIIGDEGAILIFMHGSKVVRRLYAPSPQPSHSEAMTEIMRANPNVPVSVLADVIDQQYVPQNFPPVSSMSVGGLVKRRLERDFQPEDLKGALPLGRDKTGRKEWKYLLVSLAKTPLMSEWLDVLMELPNEMKGIYLVPVEAVNYVTMLAKKRGVDKPRPWQLLISHNKISGFRQVVMHEGKLIFTRVSQAIDDAIPAVIAGNVEQEIINTIEYLKRLEFRDSADLEATVIISQDVIDSLDMRRFNFSHAEALTPLAVAERLGLEQAALSADRFGDVVMAAAFGISKKRILRFSNAYIDKLSKLYVAQIGLKAFAALCVLGLVGMSVMTFIGMIGDYSGIGEAETKAAQLKPELARLQKAVDGLNRDVAFKSAVVATYDSYLKDALKPEDFAADMAPFINNRQRITSFLWDMSEANAIKSTAPGQAAPPPPAPGASNLPLKVKLEIDFAGAGNTLDVVDKTATEMLDAMKNQLPKYEITAEPFPWAKVESNENVALDLNAPSSVIVTNTVATLNIRGVKKDGAAAPGQPGSPPPGAVPGMPGGM